MLLIKGLRTGFAKSVKMVEKHHFCRFRKKGQKRGILYLSLASVFEILAKKCKNDRFDKNVFFWQNVGYASVFLQKVQKSQKSSFWKTKKSIAETFYVTPFSTHLVWMTTSVFSDMDNSPSGYRTGLTGRRGGHRLGRGSVKTDKTWDLRSLQEKRSKSLENETGVRQNWDFHQKSSPADSFNS